MKFSATAAAVAVAGLASTVSADYISALSLRSASPIHFRSLTASNFRLHLGGKTAAYCPESVESQGGCPKSNTTSLAAASGSGTLSMGARVPGGQQVYIDARTGAVGYTQAHSASVPQGAIRDGWSYQIVENGQGRLTWKNGLIACPAANGVYDVYAQVNGVKFTGDCLGFTFATNNLTGPTQWQYV